MREFLKSSRSSEGLGSIVHRGEKISKVAVLAAFSGILAACGGPPASISQPKELPSTLYTQASQMYFGVSSGQSKVLVTGKSGPYWGLVSYDAKSHTTGFIAPPGASTRGGLAVAANAVGDVVASVHAYQSLLSAPVFVSTDGGASWSTGEVNAPLAPIRRPVAIGANTIYVAVESLGGAFQIYSSPLANLSKFTPMPNPVGLGKVVALYGYSGGLVLFYQASGGGKVITAASYSRTSNSWTSSGVLPAAVRGASFSVLGSGEEAATCYLGESAGQALMNIKVYSAQSPAGSGSSIAVQRAKTVSTSWCEAVTTSQGTIGAVLFDPQGGGSRIYYFAAGARSPVSYSLPSGAGVSPDVYMSSGNLYLIGGTAARSALVDLSSGIALSGRINGVLSYIFKQVRVG